MSSRLSPNQKNYDARDREILAIVKACRRYHNLCAVADKVIISTDHQSLTWIFGRQKQAAQRILRQAIYLSQFHIVFIFVRGVNNEAADALSRMLLNQAKGRPAAVNVVRRGQPAGRMILPAEEDDSEAATAAGPLPPAGAPAAAAAAPAVAEDDGDFIRPPPALPAAWMGDLVRELEADPICADALAILRRAKAPTDCLPKARYLARRLQLDKDQILWSVATEVPRVVLPDGSVRDRIIEAIHETMAHPDAASMLATLSKYYFIRDAPSVIDHYCKRCVVCLRSKHSTVARGLAEPKSKRQGRWLNVSIDFATALHREDERDAVLCIRDQFTGRVILAPASVRSTAEETVQLIRDYLIREHGYPLTLRSDGGSVFKSQTFADFCSQHDISHSITPTNVHVADVERAIGTFRERIRAATRGMGRGWLRKLSEVEFAINMAPSGVDGLCAFERDTGYKPRIPLLPTDPSLSLSYIDAVSRSTLSLNILIDAYYQRKDANSAAYEQGRVASNIKVGDMVCIDSRYYKPISAGDGDKKSAKTKYVYSEPFRVVADMENGNWEIDIPEGLRLNRTFNQIALKPTSLDG
jgi:transposase InsO family protein